MNLVKKNINFFIKNKINILKIKKHKIYNFNKLLCKISDIYNNSI